jgi:hypothetical protein
MIICAGDGFRLRPRRSRAGRAGSAGPRTSCTPTTGRAGWRGPSAGEYVSLYRRYGGKPVPRRMEGTASARRRVALDLEAAA